MGTMYKTVTKCRWCWGRANSTGLCNHCSVHKVASELGISYDEARGIVFGPSPSGQVRYDPAQGKGIFRLAWLGIEEVWDVELEDGRTISLFPCFGDTMQRLPVPINQKGRALKR